MLVEIFAKNLSHCIDVKVPYISAFRMKHFLKATILPSISQKPSHIPESFSYSTFSLKALYNLANKKKKNLASP